MKRDKIINAVIAIFTIAIISSSCARIPTKSKNNTLRISAYGDFTAKTMIVTLKCNLGDTQTSEYTLDIPKGVHAAEPQEYNLPELPSGQVTVHIKIEANPGACDVDLIRFYDTNDLISKGLLIYLGDLSGFNIFAISGKTSVCFVKDANDEWLPLMNPPGTIPFAEGGGGEITPWYSGWKDNKWV